MKLDTTGLESFPSLLAPQSDVVGALSAAPSFDLPNSNDVSTQILKLLKNLTEKLFLKLLGMKIESWLGFKL